MKRKATQMKWEDAVPRIHKCLISTVQLTQSHINELPLKAWIGANIYTAWYLDMPKFLLVVTESMLQQWNTEDRVSILDIEEAAAKNDADAFFICKLSEFIGKPGPIDPPIYVISRKNGKGSSLSLKSIHLGSTVFFIPKIINVKAGIVKYLRHVAYTLA